MTNTLEIDPIGASIRRLILGDNEIIWSGTRPDGGKGITHPCIPNFNIAEGLPNHGPARKDEWKKMDEHTYTWSMQAIGDLYHAGLQAIRTFRLEDEKLTVTTTLKNNSDQNLPINIAEHNYFVCSSDKRALVKINGVPFDKGGLEAEAKFLEIGGKELRIEIPGKPVIVMRVDGYTAFAQWSQPDAQFVCVEPIQVFPLEASKFINDAPQINIGETKIFQYMLSLQK